MLQLKKDIKYWLWSLMILLEDARMAGSVWVITLNLVLHCIPA